MRPSLIVVVLQLWGSVPVSSSQHACSQLPHVPHASVSDETRKAQYEVGDVIHFTCATGYISGPTIRYECGGDGWRAIHQGSCYLKPCVLPDDIPNGHYQIIHGEEFVFGTTIKYFCNEGYHMVSRESTRTCVLEKWTNHVPVCEPLSCAHPPADENLRVEGLPGNDDPILQDRFLKFSCDVPGKRLKGSAMLICGSDGRWDHPFPTCEDISCEVGAMHPHLTADGLPPTNQTVKVGHALRFRCDGDFSLQGPQEIHCLETGEWDAPFPTCSEKCRVTGLPDSLHFTSPVTHLKKGQTITFSCRLRSHVVRGKAEIECLENGRWSHPFPTCGPPLDCERPPLLAGGDTKGTMKYRYRHGEKVEYICQEYYILQDGPFKTCSNGEWTGEMRCLKPCTVDDEAMRHRNIAFMHRRVNKLYSTHDDVIEFRCTRGRPQGRGGMRRKCIDGQMLLPTCA